MEEASAKSGEEPPLVPTTATPAEDDDDHKKTASGGTRESNIDGGGDGGGAVASQKNVNVDVDPEEEEEEEALKNSVAAMVRESVKQGRVARDTSVSATTQLELALENGDSSTSTAAAPQVVVQTHTHTGHKSTAAGASTSTTMTVVPTATTTTRTGPLIFKGVTGFGDRRNDVLYYPPNNTGPPHPHPAKQIIDGIEYEGNGKSSTGPPVLVFFGGDIQDLTSSMPPLSPYSKYSLEATAGLLHSRLPSHHILVIRPSVIKPPYSCYENFVPSSPAHNSGIPEHTANHNSIHHLESLLRETSRLVNKGGHAHDNDKDDGNGDGSDGVSSTTSDRDRDRGRDRDLDLSNGRISLVGFSKGSVVLNQLLYEFHFYNTLHPDSPPRFINQLRHMYWLDGGHGGGKNTWITARPILDTLSRLDIKIHVHMTPYQLNDERRAYIKNEEKLFGSLLARMGVQLERRLWFHGEVSLEAHFELIGVVFGGPRL